MVGVKLHKIKIFRGKSQPILEVTIARFFELLTREKIIKVVSSNLAIFSGSAEPFCIYIHYEEFELDNKSLSDFGKLNTGGKEV